ncbi:MAG: HDOD domain-containing protein [Gammaproteobacteria bacterium]
MTDRDDQPGSPHARVQELLQLPPIPGVACKLLDMVAREDCKIDDLADLIEQDPGLAARIIGIANSAYFARPTEVCCVAEAIIRILGLNLVRGIAIGIALSKPFDTSACPDFQLERYWYRAMQTANLADRLGTLTALPATERSCLFISGLLHNLGQLILVHVFPDRMGRVLQKWPEHRAEGLRSLEAKYLSLTEIEAGCIVAHRWHLPRIPRAVMEFRHDPWRAGELAPLVHLVAYCAELASAWYDDPAASADPGEAGGLLAGVDRARFDKFIEQVRAQDAQTRSLAHSLTHHP